MSENITINNVIFAYCAFDEPKAVTPGADPRYSACIIIPKSNTESIEAIKAAATECAIAANGGKKPTGFDLGIRDGGEKDAVTGEYKKRNPAFHDAFYLNAKTKFEPHVIVGKDKALFSETSGINPDGMIGAVSLSPFAYSHTGNKGVSWGLQAVWLKKKGTPIGGGAGTSAFDEMDDGDCDEFNTQPEASAADELNEMLS